MGNSITERYTTITWPTPPNVVAYSTNRHANSAPPPTPNEPMWLKQVHGAQAVCADQISHHTEADAAFTNVTKTVCVVATADCLPILICDKQGTAVAAIHAGWRSLGAKIITNTVQQFPARPQDCLVWLGPAIGPQKFEVDADVLDYFKSYGWDLDLGFKPFGRKWLVDMYALARKNLMELGFLADNIYGGTFCTYSEPQTFYSYRRSRDTGRMLHLIWLK